MNMLSGVENELAEAKRRWTEKKRQNILAQGKRGSRGLETNIILLLKSQYEIESSPSVNKGFIRFQNMLV